MDPFSEALDISNSNGIHILSFKDSVNSNCSFYDQIKLKNKTVEGRKYSKINQKIKVGDDVLLSDKLRGILHCKVTYLHLYGDIEEYISGEGFEKVFGDTKLCDIKNVEDGIKIYCSFSETMTENVLELRSKYGFGFMGIGLEFVHEYKKYYETLKEPWFSLVRSGKKYVEGRLNKGWVAELNKYDHIQFKKNAPDADEKDVFNVLVIDLKNYNTFVEMFDDNGLENVLPGITTSEDGVNVYREWYSKEKEDQYKVRGIILRILS